MALLRGALSRGGAAGQRKPARARTPGYALFGLQPGSGSEPYRSGLETGVMTMDPTLHCLSVYAVVVQLWCWVPKTPVFSRPVKETDWYGVVVGTLDAGMV